MQRIATALASRSRPGRVLSEVEGGRPGLREPWWIRFNGVCRHAEGDAEKLEFRTVWEGHDFSRADKSFPFCHPERPSAGEGSAFLSSFATCLAAEVKSWQVTIGLGTPKLRDATLAVTSMRTPTGNQH